MDPIEVFLFILFIAGALFAVLVSLSLKATFAKYSKVQSQCGLTAQDVAERILRHAGINYVSLEPVSGNLTDHFDPSNNVLRLSDTVRNSNSIAAIGVAAHECGHAIQHHTDFNPIKVRNSILPFAQIGSKLAYPLIIIGGFLYVGGTPILLLIGIIMFFFSVLFQVVTLPVEFDASRRALKILEDENILIPSENKKAAKVLKAAAMTYVAATANAIIQLIRLIYRYKMLTDGRRR